MLQSLTDPASPFALSMAVRTVAVSAMLMVGLCYRLGDLMRPLRDVQGVATALVTNFILVPVLAVLMTRVFRLEGAVAAAIIVVGCAAGGPFLIQLARNAKADTDFAASLVVLLQLGGFIALPAIIPLLIPAARGAAWAIAWPLLITMLLPLAVGVIAGPLLPALARRARPVLGAVLVLALLAVVVLLLVQHRDAVVAVLNAGALPISALFAALAFVGGFVCGLLDRREQMVLGLGAAQRNFAAAMVVSQAFADPGVLAMTVMMAIATLILIPFSAFLGRRKPGTSPAAI